MSGGQNKKKRRRSNYHRKPTLPEGSQERYALVLRVLSGTLSMAEASRRAGLERNYFQTLVHRAQQSLIDAVVPKPAGRPPRPEREVELEKENRKLTRQTEKLQQRVDNFDHLLGVASELMQGRAEPRPTTGKRRPSQGPPKSEGNDDDDGDIPRRLQAARKMRELGLAPVLTAALVGAGASTVRRWMARHRRGLPLRQRGGPRRPRPPPAVRQKLSNVVRTLKGMVGADSLRHSVSGVSRRQAAEVKREVVTEMERERRATCPRIQVHVVGILRGFDAMERRGGRHRPHLLAAGDGAVPYRTTLEPHPAYNSPTVAAVLEQDMDQHGEPLVLRMDRASVHRTSQVADLLEQRHVLLLHGPPHHAQYYGQLERQNREHRAWLRIEDPPDAKLPATCVAMKHALNAVWRRRTLGWRTAEEEWNQRPPITIDRAKLRDQVDQRKERLRRKEAFRDASDDVLARFAIEQELAQRQLISCVPGGWC